METSKSQDPSEDIDEKRSTPNGFGLGVNNYLNHYVTVADAKSVAILTGTFAILATIIDFKSPNDSCWFIFGVGLTYTLTLITILFCLLTLYPRLGNSGKGLIFWESIRANQTPEEYCDKVKKMDKKSVEEEYAYQNWYVSSILNKKNENIRTALWFFGFSIISISSLYLIKNLM